MEPTEGRNLSEAVSSDLFKHNCGMCGRDVTVRVWIEYEHGEMGTVLGAWPEFDVTPACLGPPPEELWEEVDGRWVFRRDDECNPEECPFHRHFGDTHPEQEIVLAARRERRRLGKLIDPNLR